MVGHYLPTSRLGRYYQLGDYYRPNQAYQRQVMRGRTDLTPRLGQLPDLSQPVQVQPNLLLLGLGALAVGFFLFGSKAGPQIKQRKIARLASRREAITRQLKELEG